MADNKKLVTTLVGDLQAAIADGRSNNKADIVDFVLSSESMDSATKQMAKESLTSLQDSINMVISSVVSNEDFDVSFTQAQINAAQSIAGLAINPTKAMESLKSLKDPVLSGAITNIDSVSMGIEDFVDPMALSTESYDGEATNNALYFSIAYNLMAAKQDEFGEAFYPTIAIDPTSSGLAIEVEYTSFMSEFSRSTSGAADGSKFNKIPLVKAIYDENIFGTDKNKVIPVKRTANAAVMYAGISYVDNTSGSNITTGPLLFGKTIGLLGISQTDAMLAKGTMDSTDALDRALSISRVYFTLSGTAINNTTALTEDFYTDISVLPHSNFSYTPQGHNKDLLFNFATEAVLLSTTNTKTATSAASVLLGKLAANYTIKIGMVMSGSANTAYGDISVYANDVYLKEVLDANGNIVAATDAAYIAIKAVTDTITMTGYVPEAYRTNSNLRTRGQLVTADRYTDLYQVPLRTGISVLTSVNNASGNDNDSKLTTSVQTAGMRMSMFAVKELINTAGSLRNSTNNGTTQATDFNGVGRYFVNSYYNEQAIDLSAHVDSLSSTDRIGDIKAALINIIRDEALKMWVNSNYGVAFQTMRGNLGGKPTLIIGTNPRIKQYLTSGDGKLDLGEEFDCIVVSTFNTLIGSSVYMSFTINDSSRNTEPNPLNYGQCGYSPTVSTSIVRTVNGSSSRELFTIPRFAHITNLPIVSVLNVSGIDLVLSKIAQNRHTV